MNHMASSFYRKKRTIYIQRKKNIFVASFFLLLSYTDEMIATLIFSRLNYFLVYISVLSISFRLDSSLCMNGVCARPSLYTYRNSSGKKWNTLFLFLCICRSIVWTYMSFCDCLLTYVCVDTQAVTFICPFQCMHVIQFL